MKLGTTIVLALVVAFGLAGTTLGAEEMTLRRAVGDANCGLTHQMPGTSASCTLMCIKEGSDFSFTVDDTSYTLKTSSDEAHAQLLELAGRNTTITGDVNGTTVAVASVKAAGQRRR